MPQKSDQRSKPPIADDDARSDEIAIAQRNNEEYRRNQHSAAASGISGVLDTGHAGTGQPQELQHSGRERSGTDSPPHGAFRMPGYVSVRPHALADFQAGGSGLLTRSHHRDKVGNIHQPRLLCQPVGVVQPLRHDEPQLLGLHLVSLVF